MILPLCLLYLFYRYKNYWHFGTVADANGHVYVVCMKCDKIWHLQRWMVFSMEECVQMPYAEPTNAVHRVHHIFIIQLMVFTWSNQYFWKIIWICGLIATKCLHSKYLPWKMFRSISFIFPLNFPRNKEKFPLFHGKNVIFVNFDIGFSLVLKIFHEFYIDSSTVVISWSKWV